ncbi:MAG: heavy metal-associated domain-containing protein, partial [Angelakisella sp.]
MKKANYNVTGMTCSACSGHVEKAVSTLEGVAAVNVNLLGGKMTVEYEGGEEISEKIIKAVTDAGYGASAVGGGSKKADTQPAEDARRAVEAV